MADNVADLPLETRRHLLGLACLAAWSDLVVVPEERELVLDKAVKLAMGEDQIKEVESWLKGAPPEFDPNDIPLEHRQLYLDTLLEVILADGRVAPEECEMLRLMREMLLGAA